MSLKTELIETLDAVDTRFESLVPAIVANLEQPLLSGTWSVHDCLCHIAADTNAVEAWKWRLETGLRLPAGMTGEQFNASEIEKRISQPAEAVVAEIRAGFANDRAAIEAMDDAALERLVPVRDGMAPAGNQLRFYIGPHNHSHLDDIEAAIKSRAGA